MQFRQVAICLSLGSLALMSACAPERRVVRVEPVAVAPAPVEAPQYGQLGQVQAIDIVPVASHAAGGGAILGAVLGGVIGNQFGAGMGRAAMTGAGAVAGAVVGHNIEQRQRRDDEIYRVTVRFDDGSMRAVDFQRVDDLRVGDRVKWENGQLYRL
ncbi:MAG: glycine zipper 2TM domain-containing protein [Proteobacteria bacterium]|nr:glycine zipper 2TM domain-containing protein [Pseudomonadota bacterium]